ncbi:MAG: DUF2807 domain-containing protein [Chitinophagaceae bacterium]|nr:DUF2807 domain-containing protein [Chitinophagaceae bacterium]
MKKFVLTTFTLVLLVTSASLYAQKRVKGEGPSVTQERSVGSFNSIHTHGSFNVTITDADNRSVKVEAQQNLQEYIIVETEGDQLHIRHKKGVNLQADKDIEIHVSVPELKGVYLSGSGNIRSTNVLTGSSSFEASSAGSGNIHLEVQTTDLKTSIAGSGDITLKGKTTELDGRIAGSGNIRAKELQSNNTSISISGSGNAEVVANEKLDTKIAGSGDVKYWGNGSVSSKIHGSGSIRRQN